MPITLDGEIVEIPVQDNIFNALSSNMSFSVSHLTLQASETVTKIINDVNNYLYRIGKYMQLC